MRPTTAKVNEPFEVRRGLEGVIVAPTVLSDVDGARGFYHYRGYDAVEVARRVGVEEAWFLLHEGRWPSPDELESFAARLRGLRRLPETLRAVLPTIAACSAPGDIAALRTAVSAAGQALRCGPWLEQDPADTREQTLRLASLLSVCAAALYRLARGLDPVEPDDDVAYAASYLRMIEGTEAEPERVELLERYLVLTAEHGFNNSAFTARVAVSSGTDVGAALTAAIGAFSGPLHGGAVAATPSMLDEIGEPGRVEAWVRARLESGGRILGFGHPVYPTPDPRTALLRELARRTGGPRVGLAEALERTAVRLLNERLPDRRREANVDFYAGVVLEQAGVPVELFTCTFAVARVIGWTAHVLEQIADNRIYRPSARYTGPAHPRVP